MKSLLLILALLFAGQSVSAQSWSNVYLSANNVAFQLFSSYQYKDTLGVALYTAQYNDVILEVHYVNINSFPQELTQQSTSNVLQKFVDFTLNVTGGSLVGSAVINQNNSSVEFQLLSNEEGVSKQSFFRYYYSSSSGIITAFSASGTNGNGNISTYKTQFFGSIAFN